MPRVEACNQIKCKEPGNKCVPLLWVCRLILNADFDIDLDDGQLYCRECKVKGGAHKGWCLKAPQRA